MKIVRRDIEPDGPGSVKMVPEEADDLWVAYNLIAAGDTVMAATVRKVLREAASGGRDAERVKLKLEIKVEVNLVVEFGVGEEYPLYGFVGGDGHHTDSVTLLCLFKFYSCSLGVVGLIGIGYAPSSVCVTTTRARVETSIPRKHGPSIAGYDKALNKFFDNVLQAFVKHVDFNVVRCAVIASPGLLRHSLREVRALKDFFAMLSNEPARACYGPKHVEVAHEQMAIQTLLITDELFRQKYVNLVDSVKASGGTAHVFSSMHVSGEQLAQLTGVAAILRFPLPDLDDIEM
ncbi:protein PELOTA 1 [Sesamum angolense]|uniref:Protein PELOTA 1 n=1 Tax=Sesamum angolense TaxID=2727404 RepID=A0AAE1X2I2_9LAMI|nr:protein PELOTA 1 [Sesamum angolense]